MDATTTLRQFGRLVLTVCLILGAITACSDDKDKTGTDKDGGGKISNAVKSKADDLSTRVIYGDDNRLDMYQVENANLRQLATSTVALMTHYDVRPNENGSYSVIATNFGKQYNLCPTEPFRDQDNPAFCSGFLVGPQTIVTAGHCVRSASDCTNTVFVFDYAVYAAGQTGPRTLSADQVYNCKSVVHSQALPRGADFAVVQLDRPVVGHEPLRVRTTGEISVGAPLVVVGHPAGIPTKVADGANVRKLDNGFFVANLDTYGGNSGSAVFNAETGLVEGVLVRGEADFTYQGSCRISHVCPADGCRGEDVTKITEAVPYL